MPMLDAEDVEDLEDAPDNEIEAAAEEILDQATAARTIAELKAEIETLKRLTALALGVRRGGEDKKWRELASLLGEIFTTAGLGNNVAEESPPYGTETIPRPVPSPRQKLVLFTEHRDTLNYLESRIATLLGRKTAVVCIHGGMGREERMKAQDLFKRKLEYDDCYQIGPETDRALGAKVVEWAQKLALAAEDIVVVYYTGHGVVDPSGQLRLITSDILRS